MNKEKIMQLCNQIEMIIVTVCNTGYTLQPVDEEAIFNRTKEIMNEISAPPKSNLDRIRQMTDEELTRFLINFDMCIVCQVKCNKEYPCNKGIMEWLKQEVSEDAGTD